VCVCDQVVEDDMSLGSLELSSQFREVFDNINSLGEEDGKDTALGQYLGEDTDMPLMSKGETLPETDDVIGQVRRDDVTFHDVTDRQDVISAEQNMQACDSDSDNTSPQPDDNTAVVVTDNDMKLNTSREVRIPTENGSADDAEVKLTDGSVQPNVDEPSQSSPSDFAQEAHDSNYGDAAKCNYSSQSVDMENPFQDQSMKKHQLPDAEGTYSSSVQRSASPVDLMAESQSSGSLMTDLPDFESSSPPTASSEPAYDLSPIQNDSSCSIMERINGADEMHDGNKPASTAKTCGESKETLEVTVDGQQSSTNENVAENLLVRRISSAAEAERTSTINTAGGGLSSTPANSYRGAETDRQISEFNGVDSGERSHDSEDAEVIDGVRHTTGSEKMNISLTTSSSSNSVYSPSNINAINDEEDSDQKDDPLEISCIYQLGQRESTSSSSSVSSLVKDDTAAAQDLNSFNSVEIHAVAGENAQPNHTDVTISPPLLTPSPSPPKSPTASFAVYSQAENGFELEEHCSRQWDQPFAAMRDDAALDETDTRSPSSSSTSSSPSPLSYLGSSESCGSVAESPENMDKFYFMNETVPASQIDECNNIKDVSPLSFSTTPYQANILSRGESTIAKIKGTPDMSESILISQTSDLQRLDEDDTALAEQSELITVSTAERKEPEPGTAERNTDDELNGTIQTQNTSSTESIVSEEEQLETKVEQINNEENVNLGREGQRTKRDATMRTELGGEDTDLPPLSLSHSPSQLMSVLPADVQDCAVDNISHLEGNVTETQNESVGKSGKTFTSVSTLYLQPPVVGDNLTISTSNDGNTTVSILPEEQLPEGSSVKNERVLNTFSRLTSAFRRSDGPEGYEIVTSTSQYHVNEERTSTSVEDRVLTASKGMHGVIRVNSPSTAKNLLATVVRVDSGVVTKKPVNQDDVKSTHMRHYAASYRSQPAPVAVKRITPTRQTPTSNDDDVRYFETGATSPSSVDALGRRDRRSAVDKSTNSYDKSTNSSADRRVNQLQTSASATDNGASSLVQDRVEAKRLLQSVLTPLCRRSQKPQPVDRNTVKARPAAEVMGEAPTTREILSSEDDTGLLLSTNDVRTSAKTGYYDGRPALLPVSSHYPTVTVPLSRDFRDNNNNNKRDVIKTVSPTTRRSRPSPWQQTQPAYDVTTLPRSFKHLSKDDDRKNQQQQQLSEDHGHLGGSAVERTDAVFRRSLSMPVIDRSEAFIVSPDRDPDRVRLPPQTLHRSPLSPPPTRFKSSSRTLSSVGEYEHG